MSPAELDHHARPTSTLLGEVAVDPAQGLSSTDAAQRLATNGPNALPEPKARPAILQFLDQFRNLLVAMLLVGAVVAGLLGDLKDAIAIAVVLTLNAVLGYVQEQRAASSLAALREMLALQVRVRRDGHIHMLPADELVVGDVVLVEAGDRIPADGRVVECHTFEVDESALTGESMPVAKSTDDLDDPNVPLAERTNTVFLHTQVTKGRAVIVVAATGPATEIGQIAAMIAAEPESPTPLQRQLDRLGKVLAAISGAVVAFYFLLGMLDGRPLEETLVAAVALLVAAIPEGLPAVVTLTLALGTTRLAKGGAIVKKLRSVETLGSASVICSDKTGTLTLNQMTVEAVATIGATVPVTGEGYAPEGEVGAGIDASLLDDLARAAILCNDSQVRDGEMIGDPTEGALVVLGQKIGLDPDAERSRWTRIAEVPFDSANRVMITAAESSDAGTLLTMKGAWEEVAARSNTVRRADGTEVAVDDAVFDELRTAADGFAERGMRVLALASRPGSPDEVRLEVSEMTILGLAAIVDPPRPEARAAVLECRSAGIDVKMITGDHVTTAKAIAESVGIVGDAVEGVDLDDLDDAALAQRIDDLAVFARVSPRHKMRIIAALKARGEITAMTGDGVNDAPALRAADIGVAMGQTGTEVAKEAADVVLASDDFSTIAGAVREGRVIYDNIVKFVRFQLATNVGALLTIIVAELANMPTPFSPIQLLWINLIMDGPPALALAVDPAASGVMQRKPRPIGAQILSRIRLVRIAITGATMMAGTLAVLAFAKGEWGVEAATTMAFTTFVLFQVVNALAVRDEFGSLFTRRTLTNAKLWVALVAVMALQVVAVQVGPLNDFFSTTGLTPTQWAITFGVTLVLVVVEEISLVAGLGRVAQRSAETATGPTAAIED